MQTHRVILTIILLSLFQGLFAQNFTASVNSKNVTLSQNIEVRFTISGNFNKIGNINFPTFDGFRVLNGPSLYQSSMNINGQASRENAYVFVIQPLKTGQLTIQPASVEIDGKKYNSKSISISVSDKPASQQNNQKENEEEEVISPDDVFAKTIINKTNVYKGEAVYIINKVYSKKNIVSLGDVNLPSYAGFLMENMDIGQLHQVTEIVDGVKYNVVIFQKIVLFPQKTGKISLESFTVDLDLEVVKTRKARNQMEYLMYGPVLKYSDKQRKRVAAPQITLNVKNLPPLSSDFSELVGTFSLDVQIDKNETQTNDPITLKIKVDGTGNLKLLNQIDLNLPDDIETYDPKIKENIAVSAEGYSGTKTFEYLLIPRTSGTFTIPEISFTYFDTKKGQYITLKNKEIEINVSKGKGDDNVEMSTGLSKKEVEMRNKDIQFIQLKLGELIYSDKNFIGSTLYYILFIIPVLLLISFHALLKKSESLRQNTNLLKKKKATSFARKRFKLAQKHLNENNHQQFYSEVLNSLYGYISDKLTIPASDLSKEIMKEKLLLAKISNKKIDDLIALLDDCEFARYAPQSQSIDKKNLLNIAMEIVASIEKEVKK